MGSDNYFESLSEQMGWDKHSESDNVFDDQQIFEGEAPSQAQRSLAMDFLRQLEIKVKETKDYPSPLDILEMQKLHLEKAKEKSAGNDIFPSYTIDHARGASRRLAAYYDRTENNAGLEIQSNLDVSLKWAKGIEEMEYPLILKRDADKIQDELRVEYNSYIATKYPKGYFDGYEFSSGDFTSSVLHFFPNESENQAQRMGAMSCVRLVTSYLREAREVSKIGERYPFGTAQVMKWATWFGHDDDLKYSIDEVFAAS